MISRLAQSLLWTHFRLPSGILCREVGHMPSHDEIAQGYNTGILRQLAQGIDCKGSRRTQEHSNPLILFSGKLTRDHLADSFGVVEKLARSSPATSCPLE